jgi:hypothetical protein
MPFTGCLGVAVGHGNGPWASGTIKLVWNDGSGNGVDVSTMTINGEVAVTDPPVDANKGEQFFIKFDAIENGGVPTFGLIRVELYDCD